MDRKALEALRFFVVGGGVVCHFGDKSLISTALITIWLRHLTLTTPTPQQKKAYFYKRNTPKTKIST